MIDALPLPLIDHIVNTIGVGVALLEPVGDSEKPSRLKVRYQNRVIEGILTVTQKQTLENFLHSEGLLMRSLQVLVQRESLSFDHLIALQGIEKWYAIRLEAFDNLLLLIISDITQQKQYEIHIRNLAFSDDLTGIYNRRYFRARAPGLIALARREGWSVGLIYFDLNGFKAINDAFGHSVGDKVLQAVAWRLSQVSRDGDVFFRSGGDEFALFLPNTDENAALQAAQRIASHLVDPFVIEGQPHAIGASIGIAVLDSREATVDLLLEQADAAMYRAKERKGQERVPIFLWPS
jgi:diguanylate cyclase (GGDEF)-like protein